VPTPIALLELTGLGLSLGGRRILDGIDLAVAEGEQHALLAPNGAGKSSLAYALMGCSGYRPGAGQIGFRGEDIGRLPIHERARMVYSERQYHGLSGGIEVLPKTRGKVGEGACFRADFSLTQGRVGLLDIDFEVEVAAEATAELTSKVFGHVTDEIRITERVYLNGRNARELDPDAAVDRIILGMLD
jgi:energy-coupling factor transporter ATP-binding protein EcfA2